MFQTHKHPFIPSDVIAVKHLYSQPASSGVETFTASRNILVMYVLSLLPAVCEPDRIVRLKLKYLRVPQCGQHSPSETVALAQEIRGQEILRQTVAESCKSAQIRHVILTCAEEY